MRLSRRALCWQRACWQCLLCTVRRRESERKLEIVFERVSSHLDAISTSVEQAVARMVDAQREPFAAAVARLRRTRRRPRRRSRRADGGRRRRPSRRRPRRTTGPRIARRGHGERARRAGVRPSRRATFSRCNDRLDVQRVGRGRRRGLPVRDRCSIGAEHGDSGNTGGLLVDVTRVLERSTRRRCTGWLPSSARAWRTRAALRTSKPGCFTIPRPVLPAAVATRWSWAGKSLGRTGQGGRCRSCWLGSTAPRQRRRPAATRASTRSPDSSSESRERATSRADGATASSRS